MVDILVLSDTHLKRPADIPPIVLAQAEKSDFIIHAGDFTQIEILERLEETGEVIAVRGNMDGSAFKGRLPDKQVIKIEGVSIGIMHGAGPPHRVPYLARAAFKSASIIVYGHSHVPDVSKSGDVLMFNPGSTRDPRSFPLPTYGQIQLEGRHFKARVVRLNGEIELSLDGDF